MTKISASGTPGTAKDPQFAYTLSRGLQVLRAFDANTTWVSNKELSELTGIARPTVVRLTRTLATLGYLRYDAKSARYRVGPAALCLGYPFLVHMTARKFARPLMQQLADYARGSVSLGMRDGANMVLFENCVHRDATTARPDIGATRAISETAMGRAFLATLEEADRGTVIDEIHASDPARWQQLAPEVEEEISRYHTQGFCVAKDTSRKGIHSIATAIGAQTGLDSVIVNCAVASFELKEGTLEEDLAPRLLSLAQNVNMSLGLD